MMHKLSLYLNDDQYERLKLLQEHSDFDTPEEYANELLYNALFYRWCKYKAAGLNDLLNSDDFDDEIIRIAVDGIEHEIWSDGNSAVISWADSEAFNIQMIEGKYHFILENGTLVECSKETHALLDAVFKNSGIIIKDFSREEMRDELLIDQNGIRIIPQEEI